ncbi:MAG TPA: rRNA adenine N(6)-methyltransferase family protein [Gaiellaceae bacterium]|nr:rRNA adenine N(6)-methyltransferase family protein [Gaiellaceae bacterium]
MSSVRDRAHARPGGRHLLRSGRFAELIVADAGVEPGDLVVDVGAGSGMLTRALLHAGARVVAVEQDRDLAARLQRACAAADVVRGDARQTPWPDEPFRVVANLPFAHTTEICRSLLRPSVPLLGADLVVEWGFAAKRTRVWPSTMLGVLWGAWFELTLVRRVAPASFAPPPSVVAAVLRATRREAALVAGRDAGDYARFLARAFRSARLPPGAAARAAELGFDRRAAPRDLDARQWAAVWEESSARTRTVHAMTRRGRTR